MGGFRIFFRQHRAIAFMIVMLALALKAAVPPGVMVEAGFRTITVQMCHDASGNTGPRQIVVPHRLGHEPPADKIAKETCPYAGLSMSALGGADPVLLALALAFILALAHRPVAVRPPRAAAYLRPPLRGPPVLP
jgi:hypothetical protein